jgi:DNA-binding PadR family transcriptional regulator
MAPTDEIRITGPTLKVVKLLLEKPLEGRSGADISRAVGVGSGTLYPLLARLENAGWLQSDWEAVDPAEIGRPRRRFYKLTGLGQTSASRALAEFQVAPGALQWNWS